MTTFLTEFSDLLKWTVTFKPRLGTKDTYGNEQWSTGTVIKAYGERDTLTEAGPSPLEAREGAPRRNGSLWVDASLSPAPKPTDKFVLPGNVEVEATNVMRHYRPDGTLHHFEIVWQEDTE